MAQRTTVQLVDDLTGKDIPAGEGETVLFGLDGISYEIDLTTSSADKLRSTFSKYTEAARRTGGTRSGTARRGRAAKRSTAGYSTEAVRAWAASNGFEVSTRGRIPSAVLEAYQAAGN